MKYLEDQCFLINVIFKNAEVILGYSLQYGMVPFL